MFIQLTVIHGQGGGGGFQLLHKGIGGGIFDLGAALQILQPSGGFDHLKLRSAAAIAIAKGHQPLRERLLAGNVVLVANALNAFQQPSRVGPGIDHKKVRYHAGTVDAFPDKGFIGEAVGIVPGELGGQKSGHTKTLHNLWQGGAVAKGIRQPEYPLLLAELIPDVPGAPQKLADKGGPAISNDMDFLHYAFAQLGSQLQATLEQAYHNKELAYQSEIKYLQAQINPHFLYNSFYHLYRMAKMEDTDGIAEMSLKLSSYYRYITRSAQPVVTLAMEYQNIVDYTEIQTIRFGDRITVQLQPLPEPYRELAVPRFILQPLFENAYNHGVEKMENGLIQLRFKMKPEFLNIYVENNGSCPDAELEKLTQYLNSTDRKAECTALKNVKLRMQMQGGDLQVSHGTLGGFGVSLRLPLHPAHSLNTEQQNGQPQKEETSHADTVACG